MSKESLYFISAINPFEYHGGEYLRARYLIELLAYRYNLVILIPDAEVECAVTIPKDLVILNYKTHYNLDELNIHQTWQMVFQVNSNLAKIVGELCTRTRPTAIWFDYMYWWPTVQEILKRTSLDIKTIWGTHNVQSCITLQHGRSSPKVMFRFCLERLHELLMAKKFSVVCSVSDVDASFYRSISPNNTIAVIPNSVKTPRMQFPAKADTVEYACVTGNFDAVQNYQGVRWLLDEVVPLVLNNCPDFKILIAGRGACRFDGAMPCTRTLHKFDDVGEVFSVSKFSLIPIFLGSGTRFKALEAMAHGKAIISTSRGVEGITVLPDQEYMLANSASEFAAAIVRLWRNSGLCSQIGANAKAVFEQKYSESVLSDSLEKIISGGYCNTKTNQ